MKINIDDYKNSKLQTQKWYFEHGKGNFNNAVSVAAASFMIPCIVVCFQLGESIGWTEEVINKINFFIKSYGYKTVLNIPESFPKERLSI